MAHTDPEMALSVNLTSYCIYLQPCVYVHSTQHFSSDPQFMHACQLLGLLQEPIGWRMIRKIVTKIVLGHDP